MKAVIEEKKFGEIVVIPFRNGNSATNAKSKGYSVTKVFGS